MSPPIPEISARTSALAGSTLEHQDTVLLADDIHVPNFMTGNEESDQYLRKIQGMIFDAISVPEQLNLVHDQLETFKLGFRLSDSDFEDDYRAIDTLRIWKRTLEDEVKNMESLTTEAAPSGIRTIMTSLTDAGEPKEPDTEQTDMVSLTIQEIFDAENMRCNALIEHCQSKLDENSETMDCIKDEDNKLHGLMKGYRDMLKANGFEETKSEKQGDK